MHSLFKMLKCRTCLKSYNNTQMITFDEKMLLNFNLITNLEIKLSDVLGQQLCGHCYEMINLFIDFRNQCIQANSVFQRQDFCEEDMKVEIEDTVVDFKMEIDNHSNDLDDASLVEEKEIHDNDYEYELLEIPVKLEDTKVKKPKNIKKAEVFPCGLCAESFDEISSMANHLETCHRIKKDLTCLLCSEKCFDWPQLIAHRLIHVTGRKQKICHICFKVFKASSSLEQHYKSVHTNEKFKSICKFCNRSYKNPLRLRKHTSAFHSNKIFICDYCSKVYFNKQYIKSHIVSVHMDIKPFMCDQCDYTSKRLSNLKTHKLGKHTPTRVYCKTCNRTFATKSLYDEHRCTKKICICSFCGKQFLGSKGLNSHMRSHAAVGSYRCARCPAVYRSRTALKHHIDRHDGVRSKRCEYCPMTFVCGSSLIKHRRTHTGIKPYVCKICQKGFTGNNNLKVHMRVHGEYNLVTKRETATNGNDNSIKNKKK